MPCRTRRRSWRRSGVLAGVLLVVTTGWLTSSRPAGMLARQSIALCRVCASRDAKDCAKGRVPLHAEAQQFDSRRNVRLSDPHDGSIKCCRHERADADPDPGTATCTVSICRHTSGVVRLGYQWRAARLPQIGSDSGRRGIVTLLGKPNARNRTRPRTGLCFCASSRRRTTPPGRWASAMRACSSRPGEGDRAPFPHRQRSRCATHAWLEWHAVCRACQRGTKVWLRAAQISSRTSR
jgi:hypothetical protein